MCGFPNKVIVIYVGIMILFPLDIQESPFWQYNSTTSGINMSRDWDCHRIRFYRLPEEKYSFPF